MGSINDRILELAGLKKTDEDQELFEGFDLSEAKRTITKSKLAKKGIVSVDELDGGLREIAEALKETNKQVEELSKALAVQKQIQAELAEYIEPVLLSLQARTIEFEDEFLNLSRISSEKVKKSKYKLGYQKGQIEGLSTQGKLARQKQLEDTAVIAVNKAISIIYNIRTSAVQTVEETKNIVPRTSSWKTLAKELLEEGVETRYDYLINEGILDYLKKFYAKVKETFMKIKKSLDKDAKDIKDLGKLVKKLDKIGG